MSQLMNEEEIKAECEVRRKVAERGYAFLQIQLYNGEWSQIGVYSDYATAENKANQLQSDMTKRNHRMYHFRVV